MGQALTDRKNENSEERDISAISRASFLPYIFTTLNLN